MYWIRVIEDHSEINFKRSACASSYQLLIIPTIYKRTMTMTNWVQDAMDKALNDFWSYNMYVNCLQGLYGSIYILHPISQGAKYYYTKQIKKNCPLHVQFYYSFPVAYNKYIIIAVFFTLTQCVIIIFLKKIIAYHETRLQLQRVNYISQIHTQQKKHWNFIGTTRLGIYLPLIRFTTSIWL